MIVIFAVLGYKEIKISDHIAKSSIDYSVSWRYLISLGIFILLYVIGIMSDKGAGAKRARHNSSLLDAHILKPGDDTEDILLAKQGY